jgi:hypothetical protein
MARHFWWQKQKIQTSRAAARMKLRCRSSVFFCSNYSTSDGRGRRGDLHLHGPNGPHAFATPADSGHSEDGSNMHPHTVADSIVRQSTHSGHRCCPSNRPARHIRAQASVPGPRNAKVEAFYLYKYPPAPARQELHKPQQAPQPRTISFSLFSPCSSYIGCKRRTSAGHNMQIR